MKYFLTRRVIRKTCKCDRAFNHEPRAVRFVVGQGTGREINSARVISFNLDLHRERERDFNMAVRVVDRS